MLDSLHHNIFIVTLFHKTNSLVKCSFCIPYVHWTTSKLYTAVIFVTVNISYITLRYICDLSLYQTTPASLQCSISS